MSGEPSVVLEHPAAETQVEFDEAVLDEEQTDPITAFLEKHGSSLLQDHEGQLVTVEYAYYNCPPFARLVSALGEGALSQVALPLPKEEKEEEVEELEAEEETLETEKQEVKLETNGNKKEKAEIKQPEETKPPEMLEAVTAVEVEKTDTGNPITLEAVSLSIENPLQVVAETKSEALAPADLSSPAATNASSSYIQEVAPLAPASISQPPEAPPVLQKANEIEAAHSDREVDASLVATETTFETSFENEALKVMPVTWERSPLTETAASSGLPFPADKETTETTVQTTLDITSGAPSRPNAEILGLEADYAGSSEEDDPDSYLAGATSTIEIQDRIDFFLPESIEPSPETRENAVDFTAPQPLDGGPVLFLHEAEHASLAAEISIPIEEVEETLDRLQEKVEALEPDRAEVINQILDRVKELPERLEISNDGGTINEIEIREELEEQFIKLFNQVGIEYTPDLIDAFVEITLKNYFETAADIKAEAGVIEDVSYDRGTHEVIKKIVAGTTNIRKTLVSACLIGKSAVHLYVKDYTFHSAV